MATETAGFILSILLALGLLVLIAAGTLTFFTVKQQTVVFIQRLGKFHKVATSGLNYKIPLLDAKAGYLSLRLQQAIVKADTKTKDNVFVKVILSIQYCVKQGKEYDAFYKLIEPVPQIESFVLNLVRSEIPTLTLDDAFLEKDKLAGAIQTHLAPVMESFGYTITQVLITDIQPDDKVVAAMNEINAQQRYKEANLAKGEAEKILVVKQAEAEAESKKLQGEGIANQRKAIVEGLKSAIADFKEGVGEVSAKEVMVLILLTQYFDMMKAVGESSKSSTILIPHTPGFLGDLTNQITEAIAVGAKIAEEKKTG